MDADTRAAEVRAALTRISTMKNDAAVVTANVLAIAAMEGSFPGAAAGSASVTAAYTMLSRAVNDFIAASFVLLNNSGGDEVPATESLVLLRHHAEQEMSYPNEVVRRQTLR